MIHPTAVRDDQPRHRFTVDEDGETAQLVYDIEPGRLILVHTEVPDALGGRGIGGALVRSALDRARAEGLTVLPWCPFARRWLRAHPDAAEGVTIDWSTRPAR